MSYSTGLSRHNTTGRSNLRPNYAINVGDVPHYDNGYGYIGPGFKNEVNANVVAPPSVPLRTSSKQQNPCPRACPRPSSSSYGPTCASLPVSQAGIQSPKPNNLNHDYADSYVNLIRTAREMTELRAKPVSSSRTRDMAGKSQKHTERDLPAIPNVHGTTVNEPLPPSTANCLPRNPALDLVDYHLTHGKVTKFNPYAQSGMERLELAVATHALERLSREQSEKRLAAARTALAQLGIYNSQRNRRWTISECHELNHLTKREREIIEREIIINGESGKSAAPCDLFCYDDECHYPILFENQKLIQDRNQSQKQNQHQTRKQNHKEGQSRRQDQKQNVHTTAHDRGTRSNHSRNRRRRQHTREHSTRRAAHATPGGSDPATNTNTNTNAFGPAGSSTRTYTDRRNHYKRGGAHDNDDDDDWYYRRHRLFGTDRPRKSAERFALCTVM